MTDDTRVGPREPEPAEAGTAEAVTAETAAGSASASTADPATAPTTDDEAPGAGDAADAEAPGAGDGEVDGAGRGRRARRATRSAAAPEDAGPPADAEVRRRPARWPVPVLAGLLVLLLAGTGYLWFTRPGTSSVRTDDYVDALQAARSGIVDVASFDYLTLDDDITQIQAVTTGDLATDSVEQLNSRRQDITDSQAVVNTEVVGAAVGAADNSTATVFMVIQSTQTTSASQQAQVQRYRIEVDLTKDGDRWLLSGISGR